MKRLGIFLIGIVDSDIYREISRVFKQDPKYRSLLLVIFPGTGYDKKTLKTCRDDSIIIFFPSAKENDNRFLLTSLRSWFKGSIIVVSDLPETRRTAVGALGGSDRNYECATEDLPRLFEEVLGLID